MCLPHISVLRCPTSPSRCVLPRPGLGTALGCKHAKNLSPSGWERDQPPIAKPQGELMPGSALTEQQMDSTSACSHGQAAGTPHLPFPAPHCTRTSHQDLQPQLCSLEYGISLLSCAGGHHDSSLTGSLSQSLDSGSGVPVKVDLSSSCKCPVPRQDAQHQ